MEAEVPKKAARVDSCWVGGAVTEAGILDVAPRHSRARERGL